MNKGMVYLVGAGPGDKKLITVKGLECIQQADVILYDRLINVELLDEAPASAERIYCGKEPGRHALIQEQIHDLLVEKANEGKVVVRLKGGDPAVFGRVGEEAEVLKKAGIRYEIVPGISAGIAAAAYAGIPVTHRDHASSFAMVTAHASADKEQGLVNWQALSTGIDTIAFYMGVKYLPEICENLLAHGRAKETPVAIIEWATTERQRTVVGNLQTITELAQQHSITHPSIVLVGDVVSFHDELRWFEPAAEPIEVDSLR